MSEKRKSNHHRDGFPALRSAAQRGARAAWLAIGVSSVLACVKVLSGVVGNSYALIADGVESMLDILSSLVVLGSVRVASNPPNERFPYGYGKIEPLAGMWLAFALLAAATGIAIQSVREILGPEHSPAPFTLIVLVAVVAVKEGLFRRLLRTGGEIGSRTLMVDAWHHRSDALTSAAAFVGIAVALLAGKGYEDADDWAALFACLVIAFNGIRLFRASLADAMDAAPSPEIEGRVRETAGRVDGVESTEKCHIRRSGLGFFVDLHVIVAPDLTVRQGHGIAHQVKDALLAAELGILDVVIHIEPRD